MTVDRDTVLTVARLARLALRDDEIDAFRRELEEIVAYVRQLDEVDTTGVEPTTRAGETSAERPDVVLPGLDHETALAGAPRVVGGGFAVPAFVDEA